MGRLELHAISGARFWVTLSLVIHRALLTLWIADDKSSSTERFQAAALSKHACAFVHFAARDLVSFYFILSGFSMTWGHLTRDLGEREARNRYWLRRVTRFYPDFFIGTSLAWFLNLPSIFGCSAFTLGNALYNLSSLLLITCWYNLAVPWADAANGPAWFMATLFWLWLVFPLIKSPVASFFSGDSTSFWLKLSGLWALSLAMWAFLNGTLFFHEDELLSRTNNISSLQGSLKMIPLLRLPEFIMGMAVAIRLNEDRSGAYTAVGTAGWAGATVGALPTSALSLAILYWMCRTVFRPVGCVCLDYRFWECYGWQDLLESRLAPLTLAAIYGIASCEVAASQGKAEGAEEAAVGGQERTSPGCLSGEEETAVMAAHGEWGEEAIRLLRVEPFCSVGKWGLQLFVYQAASHTLVEGVLATLHLGIHTRCATQPMALPFASVYVTAHVAMTYFVAWLMTNNGPIGKHIHAWAGGHAPS